MLFDLIVLPSHVIVPLGIALAHIALCLYVLFQRRLNDATDCLFVSYLFLTILWDINLAVALNNLPTLLPGLTWAQLASYGMIVLGMVYWAFARAFLQRSWTTLWGWAIGVIGLVVAVILDTRWVLLPPEILAWSNGWITTDNIAFVISAVWGGLFLAIVAFTATIQQFQTQSPAHRNRIQYLPISLILLTAGYGLYLSLLEPFWAGGLIITLFGNALLTYTVTTVEELVDLGTGVRRLIRLLVAALVTITIYVTGIYLVQFFLGDFLASISLSRFLDHTLLVATVTAMLLTIVYTPIRRISRRLTDRVLFGQRYSYQAVIHNYSQAISNLLYLDQLADTALTHIKRALGVDRGTLFILDAESTEQFHLRTLPAITTNNLPKSISLKKGTLITHRLVNEGQALAQYTIDISPQFRNVPASERQTLKVLNFEWFIPILKKGQLIGIFALGPKKSGRPYTAQDMRLLATLADQTALALENAALFDRVQRNLEEITRMKNLMDNVFDSMDNGVITTDVIGKITLFNQAAESILATPLKPCIGLHYTEALPSLASTVLPELVTYVTTRESRYTNYEITSELPKRGKVNLSLSLAPLKDVQDQTQGVAIVMDDLTETKHLRAVQDMFRRYVSPAVVDRLPSDPADLRLGGHRQQATILFADIRGFTTFSEKLAPEELVDTLNQYLSMAASSILMYEGTLDKFMGDAVMGIFNAPLKQADHVLRAVRAADAMQRAIAEYHGSIGRERGLTFGAGIHVGEVVVGNVGTADRMDYTAIGDAVNVAKRIQENTPGGKVLMSEAVYAVVKDSVGAVFYKEMQVKGREQSVRTYELHRV